MRHRKRRTKLSMKTAHRDAMLRNMVRNLLRHQRVETTLRRAKETRRLAENVITMGKSDSVAARRQAYDILSDRDLVAKLFKEIAPLFKTRNGGFTRIIPLGGFRRGDGATMAILELTERKIVEKKPKKAKPPKEEQAVKDVEPKEKAPKAPEAKPQEPKAKTIPKARPTLAEKKRAERAKTEEKKFADKKGFLKNLRRFFRRKTDM